MDTSAIANLFSGLAFPSAVAAYLLIKTTDKLDDLSKQTLRIAEAVDRMEQREAARHERL